MQAPFLYFSKTLYKASNSNNIFLSTVKPHLTSVTSYMAYNPLPESHISNTSAGIAGKSTLVLHIFPFAFPVVSSL